MTRILRVAWRDFLAIVATKTFVLGLLVAPVTGALLITFGPALFDDSGYVIEGEYGVVDPTGEVLPQMETAPASDVRLTALDDAMDAAGRSAWLDGNDRQGQSPRKALIVIHADALQPAAASGEPGTYDLYVTPGLDDRDLTFIHRTIREAIVDARVAASTLDRAEIEALLQVPRQPAITVGPDAEQRTYAGLNEFVPLAFMILMLVGILSGGQTMLVSTVEEKSNRVVEVLLSAVSPMELMAGKLLAGVAVSLLTTGIYLGMGLTLLVSLSLFGLFDLWLIPYFVIFYLIGFFVIGSLMLGAGAAVNDMREAGQLQTPLMVIVMIPWFVWPAISRSPDAPFAVVLSYLPPLNTFAMLIRLSSTQPPPWWEVWLSIAIGLASVVAAIWAAAKVFRIGLLMYGKPPDLRTLMQWIRAA